MRIPRFVGFEPAERLMLETALESVRGQLTALTGLGLERLQRRIRNRLNLKDDLVIRCREGRDQRTLACTVDRDDGEIVFYRTAFALGQEQVSAALFRELVLIGRGSTLDAEALQHHFYPGVAALPSPETVRRFRRNPELEGLRAGRFVLWNPVTGEVHARKETGVLVGALLNARFDLGNEGKVAAIPPAPAEAEAELVEPEAELAEIEAELVEPKAELVEPEAELAEIEAVPAVMEAAPDWEPVEMTPPFPPVPEQPVAAFPPPQPVVAIAPNWLETQIPVSLLLAGMKVPPEAQELVDELASLGPMTPQEWSKVMGRMTQFLLTHTQPRETGERANGEEEGRSSGDDSA